MSFNLDDYEPVQSRFARFIEWAATRENFFAVVSDMLSLPGDDICVMKTSILCDGVVIAVGHAEEVRNAGNVNKTSHVENCETSSLGRCLANFPLCNFAGSDVNKRPSREEMGKVQRMQGNTTVTEMPGLASDKQKNMIRAKFKQQGKPAPANLDSMGKRDASALIDRLMNGGQVEDEFQPVYTDEEPF